MSTPDPNKIEVKFTRCCLCSGHIDETATDRCFIRVETKKNHVLRFLGEGDKVKATIFFRGREMTRQGLGREILERLIKDIADKGIVEFRPRQEGNTLHLILAPPKVQPGAKPPGHKPEKSAATPQPPPRPAPPPQQP